jgi:muramoyltetrapeptide carboxypeptidase
MIIPPYLKKGSTLAITATARFADENQVMISKQLLEQQGFNVMVAPNVSHAYKRFAGDDAERLHAFQLLLDDEKIDAIWLARGGYGTVRIIDDIDWTKFLKHPKWMIGFSDFTAVHLKLQQLDVASIHACTFAQVQKFGIADENVITTIEMLLNQNSKYLFKSSVHNKTGRCDGKIIGGNLSLICNSMGTPTQIKTAGSILMLEDCDEYMYHYDRMLHQLKRAGLLKNLNGLIIGESTSKPEPDDIDFGYSLEEMVLDACKEYDYPICFNAPFGHTERNYALCLNMKHSLIVEDGEVSIIQNEE